MRPYGVWKMLPGGDWVLDSDWGLWSLAVVAADKLVLGGWKVKVVGFGKKVTDLLVPAVGPAGGWAVAA